MPFKSEKQRRYLWANEPEIARDWTDTYGSRIHKNEGGINGRYQRYIKNCNIICQGMKKIGFKQEGLLRQDSKRNEKWTDRVLVSILPEEFVA